MLDALRQATRSFAVKVLLGVLVLSFAVWGVSGEFFGYRAGTLAEVGQVEVTTVEFDRTLRNRMQALSQQMGRGFSMEQARSMGLPQQILSELVAEAALKDQARQYNLGVSDDRVARVITTDPMFQGAGGRFDRMRFQSLLRNVGMTEEGFVRDTRRQMLRQQLASAVAGTVAAPAPLVEALYKYQNESRRIAYLVVDEGVIEPVGEPDDETLAAYFEESHARFRAPEYRVVGLVPLDPDAVADAEAVSEEDVRQAYEAQLSEFTRPERRRIQQMRVADEAEAQAVMGEIEAGGDFLEVAEARGLSRSDVDLGMRAKPEIIDAAVAEAAFAAEPGAVVPVLDGRLGPAIVRVTEIEEGAVRPFEEVEERLRRQIAERDARDRIFDLYDAIEDERAGGAALEEIARELGLGYERVEVAQDGTGPAGEEIHWRGTGTCCCRT
jgi:peptidyl-prolyl cis-trans isomerase D